MQVEGIIVRHVDQNVAIVRLFGVGARINRCSSRIDVDCRKVYGTLQSLQVVQIDGLQDFDRSVGIAHEILTIRRYILLRHQKCERGTIQIPKRKAEPAAQLVI